MPCPRCQAACAADARFCPACGAPLAAASATPAPLTREQLLLAAIGPGAEHYLEDFLAREQGYKGKIGWHWPAVFATFGWMLYRKMTGLAFAYLGIALALLLIGLPVLVALTGKAGGLLGLLLVIALFVVPGLFGRALYHRRCRQNIEFCQRFHADPQRQLEQIRANGGTSQTAAILVPVLMLFGCVPLIGILAAIAIPAYQDYTHRASTQEAYQQLRTASGLVEHYYQSRGTLPESLADAGFTPSGKPLQARIQLERNGTLVALFSRGTLQDKTLELQPSLDDSGALVWRCVSEAIADRLLPPPCRQ